MSNSVKKHPVALSIGLMVGNEENSIRAALESLFRQTVFERLCARHAQCEIVVVAHACNDRTVAMVRKLFNQMERSHPWSNAFTARVADIPEPGKANAWNRFVHEFSAVEARYLMTMDGHIAFHHRDAIYNLMATLERRPHMAASTGRRCPDLIFKERKTLQERISLAASFLVDCGERRLCGQLYCLRASVARNLYVPRDLGPTEAGFVAEMVCTEFLGRVADARRIAVATDAAHIFEAPNEPRAVMTEFQREMMGQAAVHVLIEHLKAMSGLERRNLVATLRQKDADDPDWLKRLLAVHLRKKPFFWQIFPGILTAGFRRLLREPHFDKVTHFPAACAGFLTTVIACARAAQTMRRRMTQYWAKAGPAVVLTASPSPK